MIYSTFGNHKIIKTENHIHVDLNPAAWVLSSAVLGGGYGLADHIINLKVDKNPSDGLPELEEPETTIARYGDRLGLAGSVVGMMTAASMNSFRAASRRENGLEVMCLLTAGISNAGRAGDPAGWRRFESPGCSPGTINIVLMTNARLTEGALVEAVVTATEAKTVALQNSGVRSRSTGAPASGTGTDAIAVVNGRGPVEIRYCGKHVLFGEMLAGSVIEALTDSLR
jgi:adenosylcobinamide amidohydrolase